MRTRIFGTIAVAAALVVWGCGAFSSAQEAMPATGDASSSDAASDGQVADAAAADGATAPDGEAGVALAKSGPQCNMGVYCDAGDQCCFQISYPTDSCVASPGACKLQAGAQGTFLLACTSMDSCPAAAPYCCFSPVGPGGTAGSRCSANPCVAPTVQLCVPGDSCSSPAGCSGKGDDPAVKLDAYYAYCL